MAVLRASEVASPLLPEEIAGSKGGGEKKSAASAQFDIWGSLIETINKDGGNMNSPPYVLPRSKSSMSQRSLEVCTESLGSETGSDGFWELDELFSLSGGEDEGRDGEDEAELEAGDEEGRRRGAARELAAVNYHCSIGRRSLPRSFPPPLPSISRRDGPCVRVRRHWVDGRLVMQAVPVPSQNYLHWHREGGRLVLSFIETSFHEIYPCAGNEEAAEDEAEAEVEAEFEEHEEEETTTDNDDDDVAREAMSEFEDSDGEVEVVDRGIVVELKLLNGGRCPSLVINKFVGSAPLISQAHGNHTDTVGTDSGSTATDVGESRAVAAAEARNESSKRQSLLHQVRGCSYHHSPLFIWEPCCVAST